MRDYIHVIDLAEGRLAALNYLEGHVGAHFINLGSDPPYSIMRVVQAFEKSINRVLNKKIEPRRAGYLPSYYAAENMAKLLLSWEATRTLQPICESSRNFYRQA